jgi:hypothetical protein
LGEFKARAFGPGFFSGREIMTTELLLLDVYQAEEEATPPCIRLATRCYPADARGLLFLTPACDTFEAFESAVQELKNSADDLLQAAREVFTRHQAQTEDETSAAAPRSVEEIWQNLEESDSLEEMKEIFNTLTLKKRQEVADFVLTKLNIFKGAASVFSQNYNEIDCLLE